MYRSMTPRVFWFRALGWLTVAALAGFPGFFVWRHVLLSEDPKAPLSWPMALFLGAIAATCAAVGVGRLFAGPGLRSGVFGAAGIDMTRRHLPYAAIDDVTYTQVMGQAVLAIRTGGETLRFAMSVADGGRCHGFVLAHVSEARLHRAATSGAEARVAEVLARGDASLGAWAAHLDEGSPAYRGQPLEVEQLKRIAESERSEVEQRAAAAYVAGRKGVRVELPSDAPALVLAMAHLAGAQVRVPTEDLSEADEEELRRLRPS
jgi:hypothetical protein